MNKSILTVKQERQLICSWPTDTLSVDYVADHKHTPHYPHTLLLFVPGNPGCIGWYDKLLEPLVEQLGVGYAARGVSYAGHGVGQEVVGPDTIVDEQKMQVAWTIKGQVQHAMEWVELVLDEMRALGQEWAFRSRSNQQADGTSEQPGLQAPPPLPRLIWLSHSIGAHFIQRILVLRQKDFLPQTRAVLHLCPFFRFSPPSHLRAFMMFVARMPKSSIAFIMLQSRLSRFIPHELLDWYFRAFEEIHCDDGRALVLKIFPQPSMGRNFLTLGMEEIREVPEKPDEAALRIIGDSGCPTFVLFSGGPDQWAPVHQKNDLEDLKRLGRIPPNITCEYVSHLRHSFVVKPDMVPDVVQFCRKAILQSDATLPYPKL